MIFGYLSNRLSPAISTLKRTLRVLWVLQGGQVALCLFALVMVLQAIRLIASLPEMPRIAGDAPSYLEFSDIRPHGYSILLAVYRYLMGSLDRLPAFQAAIYCLSIGAFSLAVVCRTRTLLAGVLVWCASRYAPGLDFVGVMSDSTFASFLAAAVACYIVHCGNDRIKWLIGASAFFGAACSTRTAGYPILGMFAFCALLHIYKARPLDWRRRVTSALFPALLMLCSVAASNLLHNGQFRIGSWGGVSLLGKGLVLAKPLPPQHPFSRLNWIALETEPAARSLENTRNPILRMLMQRQYYEYLRWFFLWQKLDEIWPDWTKEPTFQLGQKAGSLAFSYIRNDWNGYWKLVALDYASLWLIPHVITPQESMNLRRQYETMRDVAYLPEFSKTENGKIAYYMVVPPPKSPAYVYSVRAVSLGFLFMSVLMIIMFAFEREKVRYINDNSDIVLICLVVHSSYAFIALAEAGLERYVSATWPMAAAAISLIGCQIFGRMFRFQPYRGRGAWREEGPHGTSEARP